jgi:hypothetical protein
VAKERAGVVLDHPNDPRVTHMELNLFLHVVIWKFSEKFFLANVYRINPLSILQGVISVKRHHIEQIEILIN